jgi:hypothetical protein
MSVPKPKGFVTLISVLILGAVGVAIVVSLIQLGLGSSRTSFAAEQSLSARGLADACAELALERIRSNPSYVGTLSPLVGTGDCTYTVTDTGGVTRSIAAEATVGTITRRVHVVVSAVSPISLASWQEVAN